MTRNKSGKKSKENGLSGSPNSKKTPYNCGICADAIFTNTDVMECYGCKEWNHKKCTGLSNMQYEILSEGGSFIQWRCPNCRENDDDEVNSSSLFKLKCSEACAHT
jgi:hypothetical protein